MNIAIDIGNTRSKLAIFNNNQIEDIVVDDFEVVFSSLKKIPFSSGIISNVGNSIYTKKLLSFSSKLLPMSHELKYPIVVKYRLFKSLGLDRIANVVGSYSLFPNEDNLIIDMGTCITYDFINHQNQYLGGSISPGISLRFKALHTYTENLPEIKFDSNEKKLIGDSTHSGIESGVVNGVVEEIKGIIYNYQNLFPKTNIILTGGDTAFIKSIVSIKKNSIFAQENLTLIGLNSILNYNA